MTTHTKPLWLECFATKRKRKLDPIASKTEIIKNVFRFIVPMLLWLMVFFLFFLPIHIILWLLVTQRIITSAFIHLSSVSQFINNKYLLKTIMARKKKKKKSSSFFCEKPTEKQIWKEKNFVFCCFGKCYLK